MRGIRKGRPGRPGDAVLVTGAGTGIGLETALDLAGRGFRVYGTVLGPPEREQLEAAAAARAASQLRALELDITDRDAVAAGVAKLLAEAGTVYGLVNNAGIGLRGCLEDCSEEEIRRAVRDQRAGDDRGHPGGGPAHARRRLRTDRDRLLGRRTRVRLRASRCTARPSSPRRASARAWPRSSRPFGHPVGARGAGDHQDHALVAPPRHRGRARTTPTAPTTACSGPARRSPTSSSSALRPARRMWPRRSQRRSAIANPRMRYVVGRGASVVIALRRYLPQSLFERLYFGGHIRRLERRVAAEGRRRRSWSRCHEPPFLFTLWPFTGHLLPQLRIALALRERGHEVAFYSGERARATARARARLRASSASSARRQRAAAPAGAARHRRPAQRAPAAGG